MALLLEQLEWESPLVPEVRDPAWEATVKAALGGVPRCALFVAPSNWVRGALVDCLLCPVESLSAAEVELAGLLTSQENACRYCYGSARVRMKMLGFSDEMIDRIERSAQLAEAEPKERELVRFCRSLARSKPRPSRKAREELHEVGFSRRQTAELAYVVAAVGFCNRVATLLAVPVEAELEEQAKSLRGAWNKLTSWLPAKSPAKPKVPSYPPPKFDGPLAKVVRSLEGTPGAGSLELALAGAFGSSLLTRRATGFVFAVIARALQCDVCETGARAVLAGEGVSSATVDEVLTTLSSPELTQAEALLVPWARDTVWMPEQPSRIQERTRPLVAAVGPSVLVEAVGAAALANGCVRLAMLDT